MKIQHVILAPKYELATYFINFWSNEYYYWLKNHGYTPLILDAAKDTKENLDAAVSANEHAFICGGGHGSDHLIAGQGGKIIFDSTDPSDLVLIKGRHWHTVSCKFGQAKDTLLKAGLRTFCGAEEDYIFCFANANNIADPIAHTFWESENAYDKTLHPELEKGTLDGEADLLAYQASQAMYKRKYMEATYSTHKQLLMYDKMIQVHGSSEEIQPPPPQPGKCGVQVVITANDQVILDKTYSEPHRDTIAIDVTPVVVPKEGGIPSSESEKPKYDGGE